MRKVHWNSLAKLEELNIVHGKEHPESRKELD